MAAGETESVRNPYLVTGSDLLHGISLINARSAGYEGLPTTMGRLLAGRLRESGVDAPELVDAAETLISQCGSKTGGVDTIGLIPDEVTGHEPETYDQFRRALVGFSRAAGDNHGLFGYHVELGFREVREVAQASGATLPLNQQ